MLIMKSSNMLRMTLRARLLAAAAAAAALPNLCLVLGLLSLSPAALNATWFGKWSRLGRGFWFTYT